MLIALLAVLGVDLMVIVVFAALMVVRRRWLSHRPGAFKGIAQVTDGRIDQLGGRARRGYGRWVHDVLVWTPGPFCLRNAITQIDRVEISEEPQAQRRGFGKNPKTIRLSAGSANLQMTVRSENVALVTTSFPTAPSPFDTTF